MQVLPAIAELPIQKNRNIYKERLLQLENPEGVASDNDNDNDIIMIMIMIAMLILAS